MTNKEFFTAVINSEITADVIAHAESQLNRLTTSAANAASAKAKKNAEANAPIKDAIFALLTAKGAMVASAIGEALTTEENEVTTSKASAMCRQMVADGILTQSEIKVPKKGKVKQYAVAVQSDSDDEALD